MEVRDPGLFDNVPPAPPPEPPEDLWEGAEVISSYSRAQALEDGFLADVTEWASAKTGFHGGFSVPVALTAALFADIENIPARCVGQDVRGRAHDVLWMASLAARRSRGGSDCAFSVLLDVREGRRTLELRLNIGPGDKGEPVITIGYPEDF